MEFDVPTGRESAAHSMPSVHHEISGGHTMRHVLVLPMGENVMPALQNFAKAHGIRSGTIQGIGAFQQIEIGFFDVSEKIYHRKTIDNSMEVISFLGNITIVDREPFVHAHIALGAPDFSIIGGHFFNATVSVTAEFFIDELPIAIHRAFDPATSLKLITPPPNTA